LAEYSGRADDLRAAGAELVAVSVDNTERSEPLRSEMRLKFPLLCDPKREVVNAFGLLNSGEKGGIAYPAVFVIDRNRVVRFRALEEMASRVDVADLLGLVRALNEGNEPSSAPRKRSVWPGSMFIRATMNSLLRGVTVPRG
jgi:peroxiredoxin